MSKLLKIPLVLEPQQEGGWTVTSPILPELVTEVNDLKQLDEVIRDAMVAVIVESYGVRPAIFGYLR